MKHAQLTLRYCAQNMLLEILKDVERDGHQAGGSGSAGQSIVALNVPRQLMVLPVAVLADPLGLRATPANSDW